MSKRLHSKESIGRYSKCVLRLKYKLKSLEGSFFVVVQAAPFTEKLIMCIQSGTTNLVRYAD